MLFQEIQSCSVQYNTVLNVWHEPLGSMFGFGTRWNVVNYPGSRENWEERVQFWKKPPSQSMLVNVQIHQPTLTLKKMYKT